MILSNPFSQKEFISFIKDFLPDFTLNSRKVEVGSSGFTEVLRLGESSSLMTSVLIVRSTKNINSRISLTNNSFKILKTHQIYRALVVYVNDDETIWRLSLLTALPTFDSSGKIIVSYSNPRRHSYVLGTDVGIATARKYLSKMGKIKDFDDLQVRFSIEVVNKDFYKEISGHFYKLIGKYADSGATIVNPMLELPTNRKPLENLQNYSVRLIGRIVFLWFLKEKKSDSGRKLLPEELINLENSNKENILREVIEPIFFEVLNKQLQVRKLHYRNSPYNLVPYLNGGLFQPISGEAGDFYSDDIKKSGVKIPDEWFIDLFKTLNTYNFTIDENLENDVDLSIDPEMLGRVFENLLAEINPETGEVARKTTGSYYTPRSIVNFMVDESLLSYLRLKTKIDITKLKALLSSSKIDDLEFPLDVSEKTKILSAIENLRVIDPACGSGAFPMSILQKLLWIISEIDPDGEEFLKSNDLEGTEHWLSKARTSYLVKRKIIRDVIFGIDIQSVAVEIAKLRCFLTLIVDQEIHDDEPNRGVVPLPNLDFKFICANALAKLNDDKQLLLGDDSNFEVKLNEIRRRYFASNNSEKKTKLKIDYENLTNTDPKLFAESARNLQLKSFKPLSPNNQSLFFDSKIMFGFDKFNIVIGNPPYVDYRKISPDAKKELLSYSVSKFSRMINLYIYFFEMGLELLDLDGILAYISPQQYLIYPNTKGLRNLIREKSMLLLADFARVRIFDASTYTFVSIISNTKGKEGGRYLEFNQIDDFDSPIREMIIQNPISEPLNFSEYELLLSQIIKGSEKRLGDMTEIFCASSSTSTVTSSNPVLGPKYVEASNIFEWRISNVTKFVDESTYSRNSAEKQQATCIITSRMTKTIRATIIKNKEYLGGKINVVLPVDPNLVHFFVALLNSKLVNFWYREKFSLQHMQGGALPINTTELDQIPIPEYDKNLWGRISELSEEALTCSDSRIGDIKDELDSLIFQAFHINHVDSKVILRQFENY
jgi:adenine-specific DNA-methyltransferase